MNVLDMQKSLDYYVGAIGFKKAFTIPKEDGSPWIEYLKVGSDGFLELFYGGNKDRAVNYAPDQIGYHHWCILHSNVPALRERIIKKGYITEEQKANPTNNGGYNMWIHDPDGNALEIVQPGTDTNPKGKDEVLGIGHIGIVVGDIEKSIDFYRNKLGMKELRTNEKDGKPWITYMQVKPGQTYELFRPEGNPHTRANTWQSYGGTHISLECDDVPGTIEALRKQGVKVIIEAKTGADKNTQGWVEDPDGNRVELMHIHPDSPQAKA
jgi:lactoylglutathione lyase